MPGKPAAFLSYVRFNDRHDAGWISQFRELLSDEVQTQLGEEFPIFQDRKDIAVGQNWQKRIDQALDSVPLLLVIITPGFFRSSACRAEVERFLARERELGRNDLILPVYYVSTPELDDPERRDDDELVQVLRSRQFADWRKLRFVPLSSREARMVLADLATRMRGEGVFMFEVKGDSMTGEDGVLDGDCVIVDRGADWKDGDMVVISVESDNREVVVRRLWREGMSLRLQPSNPDYGAIILRQEDNPTVLGKVIGVVRWHIQSGRHRKPRH